MKAIALSSEEQRATGFSHLVEFLHTDINTQAGLAYTTGLVPRSAFLNPGMGVLRVGFRVVTPFVGCTTLALDIGDAGTGANAARFLAAQSLLTAGYGFGINPLPQPYNAADNFVTAKFTATVQNLNQLTAGRVQIYVALIDMSLISKP